MFCINDFLERFNKTYKKIEFSGLLEDIQSIRVNCVGPKKKECVEILKNNYSKVILTIGLNDFSEAETINLARDFAINNTNGNILYLHSKGVSNHSQKPECKKQAIYEWIDAMEYFLIENYSDCLDALLEHDTCGVFLNHNHNSFFYAGNFWWATNKYIASLPYCDPNNRFYSESRFFIRRIRSI